MNLKDLDKISDRMIQDLPPDRLESAIQMSVAIFKRLRREAQRRGVWDRIKEKGMPVNP